MINIDLAEIDSLYKSSDFPKELLGKYEIRLLQGFKNDANWTKLSDLEKIKYREKTLVHKQKVREITTDLELEYEKSVIKLGYLLIAFLEATKPLYSDLSRINTKPKIEICLFRLHNLLYCELYAINKHLKLSNGGHIPFDLVIEPIFEELKNSTFYQKYKLQEIKEAYKKVIDLYNQKPYNQNSSSTDNSV